MRIWSKIVDWFKDRSDRNRLIRNFNDAAKESFIQGVVPVLLSASISRGDSAFKHAFSNWLNSGFRIKAMSGRQLTKEEIVAIGATILADAVLIRRLVVLGFDTLEVHGDTGKYGLKWQLKNFLQLMDHYVDAIRLVLDFTKFSCEASRLYVESIIFEREGKTQKAKETAESGLKYVLNVKEGGATPENVQGFRELFEQQLQNLK